jgi:hypothetical protein
MLSDVVVVRTSDVLAASEGNLSGFREMHRMAIP